LAQAFERNEFATILAELGGLLSSKDPAKTDDRAPESTVARLMDICRRLVPDRQITPDTDLLDIDLNSLTLARIHEAIEREYPQRIDVTDLFDYPTLGQLAELLDTPRA
jgi:acyl carrier protein